jgi:hypothetical protein
MLSVNRSKGARCSTRREQDPKPLLFTAFGPPSNLARVVWPSTQGQPTPPPDLDQHASYVLCVLMAASGDIPDAYQLSLQIALIATQAVEAADPLGFLRKQVNVHNTNEYYLREDGGPLR